jgi:hypothetical protein
MGDIKHGAIEPLWMQTGRKNYDLSPIVHNNQHPESGERSKASGAANGDNPDYLIRIRVCLIAIKLEILLIFTQSRKLEELEIRKERERRLVKALQSQRRTQEEFEKSHQESLLIEKLARQSKQERRIAEQYIASQFNYTIKF